MPMPAQPVVAAERAPRRARYLIPRDTPRRGEFLAAAGVAAVLFHLVFAQLTIVLALVFLGITKVSRWRPVWLALPAVAGLVWTLAIGPAAAAAGLTAGPARVVSYLGGIAGHSSRIMHLGLAYSGMGHWLPRQLPIALIAAAAEAGLVAWLEWLHTDEWDVQPARPGLLLAIKRAAVVRTVRSGGVVSRDGGCLGVDETTGGRAALSWREMTGGVLVAGGPRSGTTTSSLQLVHAAIRLRKPVIAVNLDGAADLAVPLSAVCAATRAPFYEFSAAGSASYEPFRYGDPARRAALVTAMINWSGTADHCRRSFAAYANDTFELIDAAPADPRVPILDDVAHLLDVAALQARMEHVPSYHPRRQALAERIRVSAGLGQADPQFLTTARSQLAQLKASPIGQWLRPAGAAPGGHIDLGRIIRERGVVLFSLGASGHAGAAARLAWLIGQDILAADADLCEIGIAGDGLAWFDRCEGLPQPTLRDLVGRGAEAGLPVVLTTTSSRVSASLAGDVNALVIHRMPDAASAESFASLTGSKLVPEPYGKPLTGTPSRRSSESGPSSRWGAGAAGPGTGGPGNGGPGSGGPGPGSGGPGSGGPGPGTGKAGRAGRFGRRGPRRGRLAGAMETDRPGTSGAQDRDDQTAGPDLPRMISRPMVAPGTLQQLGLGEFALVVRDARRLVARALTVPARVPSGPAAPEVPGPLSARPTGQADSMTPVTFGSGVGAAAPGPASPTEAT